MIKLLTNSSLFRLDY